MFYLMVVVTTSALCINASHCVCPVFLSRLLCCLVFPFSNPNRFPQLFITSVRVKCQCVTSKKVSNDKGDLLLLLLLLLLRDLSGRTARCFRQEPIGRCGEGQAPM